MTPAIELLIKRKIQHNVHEYKHDTNSQSYGEEAAQKLGVQSNQVFKTLVIENSDAQLCVCVLPVSCQLNLKKAAKAHNVKKVKMADKEKVERVTGYVLGGVSPLGQKRRLPLVLDESAKQFSEVYISAGKRGLEVSLAPDELIKLASGKYASLVE